MCVPAARGHTVVSRHTSVLSSGDLVSFVLTAGGLCWFLINTLKSVSGVKRRAVVVGIPSWFVCC